MPLFRNMMMAAAAWKFIRPTDICRSVTVSGLMLHMPRIGLDNSPIGLIKENRVGVSFTHQDNRAHTPYIAKGILWA
jgi:hypothetical protein